MNPHVPMTQIQQLWLFLIHLFYTPFPSLIYYFLESPRNYIMSYTNILICLKDKIILKHNHNYHILTHFQFLVALMENILRFTHFT